MPAVRTGYIIYRTQHKMKMCGPRVELTKNFKMATRAHETKCGAPSSAGFCETLRVADPGSLPAGYRWTQDPDTGVFPPFN